MWPGGGIHDFVYNSGVVLWNLLLYKEKNICSELLSCVKSIPNDMWKNGDQNLFNFVLQGRDLIYRLPLQFNYMLIQRAFTYDELCALKHLKVDFYYNLKDWQYANEHITILHLISTIFQSSPWYDDCNTDLKTEWRDYLVGTKWEKDVNTISKYTFKDICIRRIMKIIIFLFPRKMMINCYRYLYEKKF